MRGEDLLTHMADYKCVPALTFFACRRPPASLSHPQPSQPSPQLYQAFVVIRITSSSPYINILFSVSQSLYTPSNH